MFMLTEHSGVICSRTFRSSFTLTFKFFEDRVMEKSRRHSDTGPGLMSMGTFRTDHEVNNFY
jgi:hypothetical protein